MKVTTGILKKILDIDISNEEVAELAGLSSRTAVSSPGGFSR